MAMRARVMERIRLSLLGGLVLVCPGGFAAAGAQVASSMTSNISKEGVAMQKHVTGAFDVKVIPQAADEAGGAGVGRMLLDKQFHGALEAVSKGQMLASGTGAAGSSGGYVALEVVSGTLEGRKGKFVLQHSATMTRGVPNLSITVVPDSGTEELAGLTGKMDIVITAGKHSYVFDYSLPEAGSAK